MSTVSPQDVRAAVEQFWKDGIRDTFCRYIQIPCINLNYVDPKASPADPPPGAPSVPNASRDCYYPTAFASYSDAMQGALDLARTWLQEQAKRVGLDLEAPLVREVHAGSSAATPMLLASIQGTAPGNVLFWGHLDKQTTSGEENQWDQPPGRPMYGPFCPQLTDDDHLYGRGSSDDGYAMFFAFAAVAALKQVGVAYPTFHMIVDFDEESGSENLQPFLQGPAGTSGKTVADVIGKPDLIVTLDSSIGDYDSLWYSVSERGTITGPLEVAMLTNAVHSGDGGGIIPNPTRIVRQLLDRVEDVASGKVLPDVFSPPIPEQQSELLQKQAAKLGDAVWKDFPYLPGAQPTTTNPLDAITDKLWRAALAITGVDGLPATGDASNVIVPSVTFELSMRVPPSVDVQQAQKELQGILVANPPYGAKVTYDYEGSPIGGGWYYDPPDDFQQQLDGASAQVFGNPAAPLGDGGTVPVLAVFKGLWPDARFMATGAAGPGNNEHAANENLDVGYAIGLASSVALVMHGLTAAEPPAGPPTAPGTSRRSPGRSRRVSPPV